MTETGFCKASGQKVLDILDVVDEKPSDPKAVYGNKKPPLHLIPGSALVQMAVAHGLGADKYGPYNWRVTGVNASTYVGAAERHLRSWYDGEQIDPESGVSHLAHALASIAILIDAAACGTLIDDRPPAAPTGELIQKLTKTENGSGS